MKVPDFVKENKGDLLLTFLTTIMLIVLVIWSVFIIKDRNADESTTEVSTTILSEPLYENNEPDGGGRS